MPTVQLFAISIFHCTLGIDLLFQGQRYLAQCFDLSLSHSMKFVPPSRHLREQPYSQSAAEVQCYTVSGFIVLRRLKHLRK